MPVEGVEAHLRTVPRFLILKKPGCGPAMSVFTVFETPERFA